MNQSPNEASDDRTVGKLEGFKSFTGRQSKVGAQSCQRRLERIGSVNNLAPRKLTQSLKALHAQDIVNETQVMTAQSYLLDGPFVAVVLFCLSIVIGLGCLCVFLVLRHRRMMAREKGDEERDAKGSFPLSGHSPSRWIAVKSANPLVVQSALGLHNLKPCSWQEGLEQVQDRDLLVSPVVDGWVLVTGGSLPSPEQDIDQCFLLLRRLSRDLGTVQFFSTHPALGHHAWAMAHEGHVVRAYAWAGETLWNQGNPTPAERDLRMYFAEYGEKAESLNDEARDAATANTEKVARLASAWSIDPGLVEARLDSNRRSVVGNPMPQRTH